VPQMSADERARKTGGWKDAVRRTLSVEQPAASR
jgi:hypothetical protein